MCGMQIIINFLVKIRNSHYIKIKLVCDILKTPLANYEWYAYHCYSLFSCKFVVLQKILKINYHFRNGLKYFEGEYSYKRKINYSILFWEILNYEETAVNLPLLLILSSSLWSQRNNVFINYTPNILKDVLDIFFHF